MGKTFTVITPTLDHLGQRLQDVFDASVTQPISAPIQDLLRKLDESEHQQARQQPANDKDDPPAEE